MSSHELDPNQIVTAEPIRGAILTPMTGAVMGATMLAQVPRLLDRLAPDLPSLRDTIPDALYLPGHVGNLGVTFALSLVMLNGFYGKEPRTSTVEQFDDSQKYVAKCLGVFAITANLIAEVAIGASSHSTGDKWDFAYGLAGAALAYRTKRPRLLEPTEEELGQYVESRQKSQPASEQEQKRLAQPRPVRKTKPNQRNKAKMAKKSRKRNR